MFYPSVVALLVLGLQGFCFSAEDYVVHFDYVKDGGSVSIKTQKCAVLWRLAIRSEPFDEIRVLDKGEYHRATYADYILLGEDLKLWTKTVVSDSQPDDQDKALIESYKMRILSAINGAREVHRENK